MIRRVKNPWGTDHRPPFDKYAERLEGQCEGFFGPCEATAVQWRPAQTCYPGGEKENPDHLLCDECAEEYFEYWKSMWDDYYSGRL